MASQYDYSTLHPKSLAARDHANQQAIPKTSDLFHRASEQSGVPIGQMVKEAAQGAKWPGSMTQHEYVSWRLYEKDRKERKAFMSDWMHWAIHDICMDEEWSEKTVDKWECTTVLDDAGIPTIPVLAVIDRSDTDYGDTPRIGSEAELVEFLRSGELPLFAKPNRLMGSFGAFRIDAVDGTHVVVNGGVERFPLEGMIEELFSDLAYVLQPVVTNHAAIRQYAEGLATLRTVNFVKGNVVRMDRAVFKIPVEGNYADNNWRAGNLLANVDPATGVIDRVTRGVGPDMVEFLNHPDTETPLVGVALPHWQEVIALNEKTAQRFAPIKYQSQDIALTDDGPLVVEVNSGGSFALPQMASGRGLLTSVNKAFFESCGVNFRKLPKPPNP